ncbi:MAG: hypothetical protein ACI8RE_002983 [Ilumatobacter sp.]|jgi:hypothetical protein
MIAIASTELLGYAASAIVVTSLTMSSVVRLRVLSLFGSTTFFTYGFLIESTPIMVTNMAIAAINIWFLTKEFRSGAIDLGVSDIRADSPFLLDFIRFHTSDIGTFQPDFTMPVGDDVLALLLTRDGLPAGVLIGHQDGDTLTVDLDYVLAAYRDSRLGNWLYGPGSNVFRQHGITQLRAEATTDIHDRYLHRMGFAPTSGGDLGDFVLVL